MGQRMTQQEQETRLARRAESAGMGRAEYITKRLSALQVVAQRQGWTDDARRQALDRVNVAAAAVYDVPAPAPRP